MACVSGETNARRPMPSTGPLLLGVAAFLATAPALAEDGPDADYLRLRTVAISVQYYDGQDWKTYPKGLGSGFLVHPGGYLLTAKHVAPEELISDQTQRSRVRLLGRIGDRSSAERPLQIVDVHPQRDVMLLKFHRDPDQKPFEYFELTDKFTLPRLQVSAAGFPASSDGTIRIITAYMTSDLVEGKQLGEVRARLEGGFSGGPVLSGRTVVGLVESSSTVGQLETFNFVPMRSLKGWLSENISLPKPVQGLREVKLAGPARLELIKHLNDRWSDLRIFLDIPRADVSKWPRGEEPERLLDWLEQRGRLGELRPAFKALGYDDLLKYLPEGGADGSGAASTAPSATGQEVANRARRAPGAYLSVKQLDNGLATLQLRFTDLPSDAVLSTIVLHLKQLGPEIDLEGQPSKRVEVARYTACVPSSIFDDPDPRVSVEADLLRDGNEVYTRADITLWYDRRDRAVRLSIIPQYLDQYGNPVVVPTTPDHVEVTLKNSRLVLSERAGRNRGE